MIHSAHGQGVSLLERRSGLAAAALGWHRHVSLVMLARMRRLAGRRPPKRHSSPSSQLPWSIQEIRRVAIWLAQRRIKLAFVLAQSAWRRACQATARHAYLRTRMQLQC